MSYFKEVECPDCEEGKVYRVAPRFTRNMEFEYDEKSHPCVECEGTGIIEVEEEEA